jgi:hypothetical protein
LQPLLKSAIAAEIAVVFIATAGHITDFVTWTGEGATPVSGAAPLPVPLLPCEVLSLLTLSASIRLPEPALPEAVPGVLTAVFHVALSVNSYEFADMTKTEHRPH